MTDAARYGRKVRLARSSIVCVSALLLCTAAASRAGDTAAPAMRAEIVPAPGVADAPSLPAPAVAGVDPALATSSAGLTEEPAPGGGMMVDLRGRFRSEVTATVGVDGSVTTECRTRRDAGR